MSEGLSLGHACNECAPNPWRPRSGRFAGATFEAMPRSPRSHLPAEGVYHVTTRGVAQMDIVLDDLDRVRWCNLAESTIARFGWICHAYCLMNNHFHLVVQARLERLSSGMRHLNGRYAERFNARYERTGHVFGARFAARFVEGEEYHTGRRALRPRQPGARAAVRSRRGLAVARRARRAPSGTRSRRSAPRRRRACAPRASPRT